MVEAGQTVAWEDEELDGEMEVKRRQPVEVPADEALDEAPAAAPDAVPVAGAVPAGHDAIVAQMQQLAAMQAEPQQMLAAATVPARTATAVTPAVDVAVAHPLEAQAQAPAAAE